MYLVSELKKKKKQLHISGGGPLRSCCASSQSHGYWFGRCCGPPSSTRLWASACSDLSWSWAAGPLGSWGRGQSAASVWAPAPQFWRGRAAPSAASAAAALRPWARCILTAGSWACSGRGAWWDGCRSPSICSGSDPSCPSFRPDFGRCRSCCLNFVGFFLRSFKKWKISFWSHITR